MADTQKVQLTPHSYLLITDLEDSNWKYRTVKAEVDKGAYIDYIIEHPADKLPEAMARLTFWQRWNKN